MIFDLLAALSIALICFEAGRRWGRSEAAVLITHEIGVLRNEMLLADAKRRHPSNWEN